ncbi:MAG: SDR family NAD(P)-dependent oxidoreductase [Acidobacteriota bacterium]|nr:SDR family NAD(P)-dependent oxidoreductase [Acidobacteriota bacterium]
MKLQHLNAMAADGPGRQFVPELLQTGAPVLSGDNNVAGLRALKSETDGLPGRLHMGRPDVTDEESVARFVSETAAAPGSLNALVQCGGIFRDGFMSGK